MGDCKSFKIFTNFVEKVQLISSYFDILSISVTLMSSFGCKHSVNSFFARPLGGWAPWALLAYASYETNEQFWRSSVLEDLQSSRKRFHLEHREGDLC